jgi:hypothetical protein
VIGLAGSGFVSGAWATTSVGTGGQPAELAGEGQALAKRGVWRVQGPIRDPWRVGPAAGLEQVTAAEVQRPDNLSAIIIRALVPLYITRPACATACDVRRPPSTVLFHPRAPLCGAVSAFPELRILPLVGRDHSAAAGTSEGLPGVRR